MDRHHGCLHVVVIVGCAVVNRLVPLFLNCGFLELQLKRHDSLLGGSLCLSDFEKPLCCYPRCL